MAMTKSQLVKEMAERCELSKKQVVQVIEAIQAIAYREAATGFTFPGIGKLVVVNRKARKGRNPKTGEEIQIPAKRALKFRVAKAAKDGIL